MASELHLSLDELHGWLVEVRGVNLSSLEAASENGAQDRLKLVGDDEEQWPSCILERAELEDSSTMRSRRCRASSAW